MDAHELEQQIVSILSRLDALESDRDSWFKECVVTSTEPETEIVPCELFGIEPLSIPPGIAVEPIKTESAGGTWVCDPRVLNVLKLGGQDLPYSSLVLYAATEISWSSQGGSAPYTTPCPRNEFGGAFPQLKIHALVFGLGARGIGCQSHFGIEGAPGSPVWISVNDTNYTDNQGRIVVRVRWQ